MICSTQVGEGLSRTWGKNVLQSLNLVVARGDEDPGGFRDNVAERMTPSQIEEAQRLAREWMEAHQ